MSIVDTERWRELSLQLGELLELEPAERETRMMSIGATHPEQAATLAAVMAHLTSLHGNASAEAPALQFAQGLAGQLIGPYTLERELGAGGMGSVWLARRTDGRYEANVAIKFLNLGLIPHGGAERFAREGSILARLAHPNIARLLDAGVAGNRPYLVLEYIDGDPIDLYCRRHALDTRGRLRLFLDVLAAVAHAHNRLILHRDLKPQNILVNAAGEVKLLDFGIAKLMADAQAPAQATELTRVAGQPCTLSYAAPEQVQQADATTATDVYALGVLLYVLLSGRHPTLPNEAPATPLQQLQALIEKEPMRLSDAARDGAAAGPHTVQLVGELRGELDSILAKALQKSPAQRYPNAAALADDIQRHLNHLPIVARPDTRVYRTLKFVRRNRLGVAAALGALVMLGAGIAALLVQTREVQVQQRKAEGLIEFMLSELRAKLQPVGRLDVLDAVGEQALAYYDGQSTRLLDADALGRRSRALHLIGEIAELRGDLNAAATMFERAAASTGQLMQRAPGRAQQIFDHSQSMYWVGYVAWRRGLLREARTAFDEYLGLARQLVRLDASNIDWQLEEAYARQNLGIVLLDQNDPAGALGELQHARGRFAALQSQRPALRSELVSSHGWIAKAKEDLADIGGAIEAIQVQLTLQRSPQADIDRHQQEAIGVAESELSRLELWRGDAAAALRHGEVAVRLLEILRATDTQNAFWAEELAWAHLKQADAATAQHDLSAARLRLQAAHRVIDALTAGRVDIEQHQLILLGSLLLADNELALRSGHDAAPAQLQRWLASVGALSSGRRRHVVAQAYLVLGDIYARAHDAAASAEQWQRGATLLAAAGPGSNPMALTLLAQLQLRLHQAKPARELAARIARSDFKHPLYQDLVARLSSLGKPAS